MTTTGSVFVSYAREDSDFVDRLTTALVERGIPVWIDRADILGSDIWQAKISAAIEDSRAVIAILSPHIVDSEYVATELSLARDRYSRKIIPILLEPWDPPNERTEVIHWL